MCDLGFSACDSSTVTVRDNNCTLNSVVITVQSMERIRGGDIQKFRSNPVSYRVDLKH